MPKKPVKKPVSTKKTTTVKTSAKRSAKNHPKLRFAARWFFIPAVIYFVIFTLMTWPWLPHFFNYYFTDTGDGMQNVWNMWWIHKSVVELHKLPWSTTYLHVPFGVTLIGQTLNPFNGFVALLMLPFVKLNIAYNIMVIFSFVMGGVTAFWLCYYFCKRYAASLIGGMIFTFSSYHFAHAEGHMQLVSLEWIPLFILLWWMFVKRPSYKLAAGVAVSLMLVLLCDYYYFLYCLMAAGGIVLYLCYRKELPNLKSWRTWKPVMVLGALRLVLVAPLPLALLYSNSKTQFTGSHPADVFSTDLFSPFINGGFWRFYTWTYGYWKHIYGNVFETSIYAGVCVIIVLLVSLFKRKILNRDVAFWQLMIVVFGLFSMGPHLLVHGKSFHSIQLPYVVLEWVIPGMKLSGMPIRMMVMVTLSSAVIVAMVLAKVKLNNWKGKALLIAFMLVFMFEMWPRPLPLTPAGYPKYVAVLKSLPSTGAVLDEAAISEPMRLYDQTLHEKPIPFGYISRQPKDLDAKEHPLYLYNTQNQLDKFCGQFKVRYLTELVTKQRATNFPIVYKDDHAVIYDLKNSPNC
jgi:hypothetical protein